jgi:DNA-binding LacI/PurR family transcriptional regulator
MSARPADPVKSSVRHVQVRDWLRDGIRSGLWPVGAQLPSVRDLIDHHDVSLPLVRMALDALVEIGLVRVEPGQGAFVVRVPESSQQRLVMFLLCNRSRLDPFFSRVLSGAERAAQAQGCVLVYRQVEPEDQAGAVRALEGLSVDGVVCAGEVDDRSYRSLVDCGLPFAIAGGLWRHQPAPPDIRIIGNDNFQGGRLATEHLLAAGHRQIGVITGPLEGRHWKLRRLGCEAALRDAGLTLDPALADEVPVDTADSAEPAVERLLRSGPPCTALFAGNDRYALAAYRVLRRLGRRVGPDLSVIGYDDLEFSQTLEPPLTTIQPDIEGIGEGAMQLLAEAFAGQPPRQVLRRVKLIERESVTRRR